MTTRTGLRVCKTLVRRCRTTHGCILAALALTVAFTGAVNGQTPRDPLSPLEFQADPNGPAAVAGAMPTGAALRSRWPTRLSTVVSGREAIAVTGTDGPTVVRPAPWWAPAASAVIPGSGQFVLRQQRSVAYLVAEAYLVLQAVASQREADRDRQRFRSIAADVARKPFGGNRPVGSWDYYEFMEKRDASGVYDRIPGGAIDPETDTSTYNGWRWLTARETFWRNPNVQPALGSEEYARALNYYVTHAYTDEFRWSWRDAQLQKDVYIQTIASFNRSNQRATSIVGLIGANHLASLVDAYISIRIRRYGGAGIAGVALDGIRTDLVSVGDPAARKRLIRTQLRLVPRSRP